MPREYSIQGDGYNLRVLEDSRNPELQTVVAFSQEGLYQFDDNLKKNFPEEVVQYRYARSEEVGSINKVLASLSYPLGPRNEALIDPFQTRNNPGLDSSLDRNVEHRLSEGYIEDAMQAEQDALPPPGAID